VSREILRTAHIQYAGASGQMELPAGIGKFGGTPVTDWEDHTFEAEHRFVWQGLETDVEAGPPNPDGPIEKSRARRWSRRHD